MEFGVKKQKENFHERTSSMKRFILTGTPGSGKTSIIHELKTHGYFVVEEAATDVIGLEHIHDNPEPWMQPDFIDKIVRLQKQRQIETSTHPYELQLYDRSPICTYALSRHLGYPPSPCLLEEMRRIERENIYQRQVFFIENLGFCEPTEARKISFEDSLLFEKIHAETYISFGYDLMKIPPHSLSERVRSIMDALDEPSAYLSGVNPNIQISSKREDRQNREQSQTSQGWVES
jgi:predicted ATPase